MPHFLLAAIALNAAEPPAPSNEEVEGLYFAPPAEKVAIPSFDVETLAEAGAFTLAASLNAVDAALGDCVEMREQISSLILGERGSYAVHPDWVPAYQACILQRDDEIRVLGTAISERKPALLNGLEGESAYRITNTIARLEVYQTRLKREVSDEVAEQKELIALYNRGGSLGSGPRTFIVPPKVPKPVEE